MWVTFGGAGGAGLVGFFRGYVFDFDEDEVIGNAATECDLCLADFLLPLLH